MSTATPASFVRRLASYVSYTVAQQLWLAAMSLVATPILYRGLGEESYGVLAIVTLVAAQLGVLELGFGHATVRQVAHHLGRGDDAAVSRTVHTAWWVFAASATLGAGAVVMGADALVRDFFHVTPALAPVAVLALRVGAVFFAAGFLANYASAVWAGFQRFDLLNVIGGVSASAQMIGSVVLVLMGFDVLAVVVWSALLAFTTLLLHFALLSRHLPGGRVFGRFHAPTFRAMARFGLVLMAAGILTQVFLSGGVLVLGHYVWVGALPFFTVPFGVFQRLLRIASGFAKALFSLVAELDGRRDTANLSRVGVSGTRLVLCAAVAAMMPAVLLARPFLTLWMGADFADQAAPLLELFFVAFVAAVAAVPANELNRGTGRAGRLVELTSILAAVNLGGVAVLAPRVGVLGGGLAFLAAELLGAGYMIARTLGPDALKLFTPRVVAFLAAAVGVELFLLDAVTGPWGRLAAALSVSTVAAFGAYLWVFTGEERQTLSGLVRSRA